MVSFHAAETSNTITVKSEKMGRHRILMKVTLMNCRTLFYKCKYIKKNSSFYKCASSMAQKKT